ncbi:MAG: DUF503 domain-containing protein [Myxococcota bacterium]
MSMVVGVARVVLIIHSAFSLKEKKSVVRQVKDRTCSKFNVALAEVGELELHNRAELGLAVVGNDRRHVNSMVDNILTFIEDLNLAEVIETDFELLNY